MSEVITIISAAYRNENTEQYCHIPQSSREPYDYAFEYGETAWARENTGVWHRVLVISEGHWQTHAKAGDGKLYRFWFCKFPTGPDQSEFKRHSYAPMHGELKPDYPFIRRLLHDESVLGQDDMEDVKREIAADSAYAAAESI